MHGHCSCCLLNTAGALAVVFAGSGLAHAAVTISSAATRNVSCSGGICAPTAGGAVLNAGDLENLLASGDVEVTTTGSGVQAKDIFVRAALSWSTASALTLDAYRSVAINRPVSVAGVAGLTITTDHGGGNGTLSFGPKGDVAFANLSSSLTIDGAGYTLAGTVKALASAIAADPSGDFALAGDFDAKQDGTYAQSPVPTAFAGTFEGLGNKIAELSIKNESSGDLGLFAAVQPSGVIRDLGLRKVNVVGAHKLRNCCQFVGGLVGDNSGTVFGASVSGSVRTSCGCNGHNVVLGGLIGTNETGASVLRSSSLAQAAGGENAAAGGLIGNNYGKVTRSYAAGSVNGSTAGGLISGNVGTVTLSHATGSASGVSVAGGLVGSNTGSVVSSYAAGAAQAVFGGGAVGFNQGSIQQTYATGAVTAEAYGGIGATGSLVGANGDSGTITQSYGVGQVNGDPDFYTGGFVGEDESSPGNLGYCYWDTDTTGITNLSQGAGNVANDPGITGLTTAQFQSGLPDGFDPTVWNENSNIAGGFPYLIANPPP